MENIINTFRDKVKGICNVQIKDPHGETVVDESYPNTLNVNFIWDMCRQQLIRTNANKRKITPLGGCILTNYNGPKDALSSFYKGSVSGFASLYTEENGHDLKRGYVDSAETQCVDGELTFTFKWGPGKIIDDFNNIWLCGGFFDEISENGGFHSLTAIAQPSKIPPKNSILGACTQGFVYALYQNKIYQYKVIPDEQTTYTFLQLKETTITTPYSYSRIGTFNIYNNCFYVLSGNKVLIIDLDGNITKEISVDLNSNYNNITCINNHIISCKSGKILLYDSDVNFIKELDAGMTFGVHSTVYHDGAENLYIYDYNLTSMQTKTTYIYSVSNEFELTLINSFNKDGEGVETAKDGKTLYPISVLGIQLFFDTYSGYFYSNHIFPCSQDVILNGGTGEILTYSKPLGYSAKIIYKIYIDIEDKEVYENQKINTRVFQDMILNMLLPSDSETEGINSFGAFHVVDNDESGDDSVKSGDVGGDETSVDSPVIGFAYLYGQKRSPYFPNSQGLVDLTNCNINRYTGIIQYRYEFDYNVSNGHFTHIQTSTNAPITNGMNTPTGRCFAPKRIAKFRQDLAEDLLNVHGDKIVFNQSNNKAYILSKSIKNTVIPITLVLFDSEYMEITQNLSRNGIPLEQVTLNNETANQIIYVTTHRRFIVFSEAKMYLYDDEFNFIEHQPIPFQDTNLPSYTTTMYHGGMQNLYAFTRDADNKLRLIVYSFIDNEIKFEFNNWGYQFDEIGAVGTDDEYVYINCRTTINTLNSWFFLVFKIEEDTLELKTYNQSRQIVDGSLISTRGLLGKYMFLETTNYMNKNNFPEDTQNTLSPITQSIYVSKSQPYMSAAHKLSNPADKTVDDFFEGIFQMKLI